MKTKIVEVTNGPQNWGKFLIGQFDAEEHAQRSVVSPTSTPLLRQIGWGDSHYAWVLDLQTAEGACFRLGGHARADLNKHQIWVCPMYEPFLEWLYAFTEKRESWFADLPKHVDLPDAPFAQYGYRRGVKP